MQPVMQLADAMIDRGLVPKPLLRHGVRMVLRERLAEQREIHAGDREVALARFVAHMRASPIALLPGKANEQHYEVPAEFYGLVLGARRKYSSAHYDGPRVGLDEAERSMLAATVERAQLANDMDVLELGCGWGSLTLYMAERFPGSRIVGVSNSSSQRQYIEAQAAARGLDNVTIVTADMNVFQPGVPGVRFDRIVSVEMFEHMRNWEQLLARARTWLRDDGLLFQHVFAHREYAYAFEDRGPSDWLTRHFFGGGMMPSHDLLDHLQIPFAVEQRWLVDGTHYGRTAEHWLDNLEARRARVLAVFATTYGAEQAELWFQRWRVFFLACAEMFAYADGREWFVSHNLLRPRS
jgi:cyclopropane-fatty-acyl-phospholipid synthase